MSRITQMKIFFVALLIGVGFSSAAEAGVWSVYMDARATTLDWSTDSAPACGSWFDNYGTTFGLGNFDKCVGGVPAGDNRSTDGNHFTSTPEMDGEIRLRLYDANNDGILATGDTVILSYLSIEQHYDGNGYVETHMHTRFGAANFNGAPGCPSSVTTAVGGTETVTCNGTSADFATGTWDTTLGGGTGGIVWDTGSAGQMKNYHGFGMLWCNSFCGAGGLNAGYNWSETFSNVPLGSTEMADWVFSAAFDLSTATAGDFSLASGAINVNQTNATSDNYYVGNFIVATLDPLPEPSTALMLGSGLLGLTFMGRRRKV